MAFKIIFVIAAIVACAQAGGPAAYSISAPSADHASVGNTQEHTVKGHYGQSSQSDYSSQVQTAHSQSHVQRSSSSNDAAGYGGHAVVAAAPVAHAYAAPAATYAAHYAAPAAVSHAYAAPAVTVAHAAPAIAVSHAAPAAVSYGHGYGAGYGLGLGHGAGYGYGGSYGHSYAAPAISYAAAPAVAHHSYATVAAAPAVSYAHTAPAVSHSYVAAAPAAVKVAAAPAYAAGYYGHSGYAAHGLGYAAHGYAAPAYAAHYAAPAVVKAAPALVHASVSGHGVHYGY